jgi:prepilin-type N-terminal cleavage/methylation domain-containing protein
MRVPRGYKPRAFTLVEILIVVIILGILATIIIGLFQNGTKDAAATSLKDNLRNMRSQLELYVAQHGRYPALATFEQQMTQYTDGDGNISATKSPTYCYGPYIIAMPVLPVGVNKGRTTVRWGYEATSGVFKANTPDAEVDQDGIAFNTY